MATMNGDIARALYAAGQMLEAEAEHSITDGSISGAGHVASLPGEPPNADTRLLDTNIETQLISTSPPRVEVSSNAPYSVDLEYGTSKMAERPYMRPATRKTRPAILRLVHAVITKAQTGVLLSFK